MVKFAAAVLALATAVSAAAVEPRWFNSCSIVNLGTRVGQEAVAKKVDDVKLTVLVTVSGNEKKELFSSVDGGVTTYLRVFSGNGQRQSASYPEIAQTIRQIKCDWNNSKFVAGTMTTVFGGEFVVEIYGTQPGLN